MMPQELEKPEELKQVMVSEKCSSVLEKLKKFLKTPRIEDDQSVWNEFLGLVDQVGEAKSTYGIEDLHGTLSKAQSTVSRLRKERDDARLDGFAQEARKLTQTILDNYRERLIPAVKEIRRKAKKVEKQMSSGQFIELSESSFIPFLHKYYNIIYSGGAIGGHAPFMESWDDTQVNRSLLVQKRKAGSMDRSVDKILQAMENALPLDLKQRLLRLHGMIKDLKDVYEKGKERELTDQICRVGEKYTEVEKEVRDFFEEVVRRSSRR